MFARFDLRHDKLHWRVDGQRDRERVQVRCSDLVGSDLPHSSRPFTVKSTQGTEMTRRPRRTCRALKNVVVNQYRSVQARPWTPRVGIQMRGFDPDHAQGPGVPGPHGWWIQRF